MKLRSCFSWRPQDFRSVSIRSVTKFLNCGVLRNFIADLRGVSLEVVEEIKNKFVTFATSVSDMNGSFVIVCEFSFDDSLIIVPTIQEAYDYIEMDEMQRQLEL